MNTVTTIVLGLVIGIVAGVALFGGIFLACALGGKKSEKPSDPAPAAKVQPQAQQTEVKEEQAAPENRAEEATAEEAAEEVQPEQAEEQTEEQAEEQSEDTAEQVDEAEGEEEEEEDGEALKPAAETDEQKAAREAAIAAAPELPEDKRYDKSYTARLMQASDEVKGWYSEIKNAALSFVGAKSSIAWKQEKIHSGRKTVAKIIMRGKTLCVYFPLTLEECGDRIKAEDVSGKAVNAATPTLLRIKNPYRVKQTKELIKMVGEKQSLTPASPKAVNYAEKLPFKTTEQLMQEGLVKVAVQQAFSDIPQKQ